MHELSIADAIVRVALRHAAGRPVARVEVRVGRLRQVVPSSLAFAFELLSQGHVLEGAELAIEEVPVRVACRACDAQTTLDDFPLRCESCGGYDVEVLAGEELLIEALELVTEPEPQMTTGGMTYGG